MAAFSPHTACPDPVAELRDALEHIADLAHQAEESDTESEARLFVLDAKQIARTALRRSRGG